MFRGWALISQELTLEESFDEFERMLAGVARSVPVEFTLRYTGTVSHHSAERAHEMRQCFDDQLEDYWSRDTRLAKVQRDKMRASQKTSRALHDVRPEHETKVEKGVHNRYYFNEVNGVKFVPLVTTWRFLRCEVAIRIYRYEGAKAIRGGVLELNGDLDNRCKVITDALRMPTGGRDEAKVIKPHSRPWFFVVLEDDRLVTKISIESREKLGRRPPKDKLAEVDIDIDVRIFPVGQFQTMNYEMLEQAVLAGRL